MLLQVLPLVFVLVGLAFYAVLGGADFGAGFWQLFPGAEGSRDFARHAIGPVWEANHVWLIFCLTVMWTAYPTAFGAIASTLSIPLFIAAIGIILRGTAYALRSASDSDELRPIDGVFSLSSVLTPFALGTVVGGIASRRVPVGNAAGHIVSSWLNPTSILIGVLAVVASAYMAAVFLSADAARHGESALEEAFRRRALGAGVLAGAIAVGGIAVVRSDSHPLYHGLVHGKGVPALAVSIVAGIGTLALVWRRRYEPARLTAALAVTSIIAGWGLAQWPVLLRGLTVEQAAAPHDTLVAVIVAVLAGGVLLFPSLALLFALVLRGRFDPAARAAEPAGGEVLAVSAPGMLGRLAVALLVAGVGFTTVGDSAWAHAIGVTALLGFVAVGFPAALPPEIMGRRQRR